MKIGFQSQIFQQNEQQQQQLLAHQKIQQLIERTQLQNVYQSQQYNLQKNKEFLDQIEFNVDYKGDILLKLNQQNSQSFNFDDEIYKIQDILVQQNRFQYNYQHISFTNKFKLSINNIIHLILILQQYEQLLMQILVLLKFIEIERL
ncbi:unnamed protein product [Paramecium pentaurelia]|uniref:Uncharacterized protein n=1 Tax=Paramecium pentaurelia TaxID=43138 RepID=A0A8S1V7Q1_9CILI|nr:unnamed protein product [Paramecium pentaurelia]